MKNRLCTAALLIMFACSVKKENSAATGPVAPPVVVGATDKTPSTGSIEEGRAPASAPTGRVATWVYEQTTDNAGEPAYKASMTSPDQFQFGFPYTGISTVSLTIRQRNGVTHVYLEVANGQFNRSFQGGRIPIRFDAQPPVTYSFSAAANGRGNILFFDKEQQLIDRIRTAQTMKLDVGFENKGKRTVEFMTAGLRWPH